MPNRRGVVMPGAQQLRARWHEGKAEREECTAATLAGGMRDDLGGRWIPGDDEGRDASTKLHVVALRTTRARLAYCKCVPQPNFTTSPCALHAHAWCTANACHNQTSCRQGEEVRWWTLPCALSRRKTKVGAPAPHGSVSPAPFPKMSRRGTKICCCLSAIDP